MYRLALVLVLLVALAGCGGSSDEDSNSPAPPAASQEAASKAAPKAERDPASAQSSGRDKKSAKQEAADEERSESGDKKPESAEEGLEAAPEEAVTNLIRQAVRATLALYDLELASLEVAGKGRSVTVSITRDSACRAVARDEPIMANQIRKGAPAVKSVSFEVAGTGEALGYHVLQCKRPEVPSGPGKVVLEREGVGGPITTREFRIRGKRWAIEYENGSTHLVGLVLTHANEANDPISSKQREVGRKVYNSGPGTYRLQIQGGGFWSVRVKDIR